MIRVVLSLILLLIAVCVVLIGKVDDGRGNAIKIRKFATIPVLIAFVLTLSASFRVVAPGEVGIPVVFGTAKAPLDEGINFVNPVAKVSKLSVRTEEYTMSVASGEGNKQGDDSVTVLGSDGAPGKVDATVLYRLDRAQASNVYKKLGVNFKEKIVRPTIRTCIREGFSSEPLVEAATTARGKVSLAIQNCLTPQLKERGILVENFQLRDITPGETVQNSINAKVAAQQQSEQQAFELQKAQQQAEIKRAEAQGLADAQKIIQQTLTPEYLQYEYIKAIQGMVNSPNNSTLVLPTDSNLSPQFVLPDNAKK